jgi:PAS domain-containing protein
VKDLYRLIRNAHVQAQSIIDTVPDPLLVLDQNLCVQTASRSFFSTFKVGRDETLGHHLYELQFQRLFADETFEGSDRHAAGGAADCRGVGVAGNDGEGEVSGVGRDLGLVCEAPSADVCEL